MSPVLFLASVGWPSVPIFQKVSFMKYIFANSCELCDMKLISMNFDDHYLSYLWNQTPDTSLICIIVTKNIYTPDLRHANIPLIWDRYEINSNCNCLRHRYGNYLKPVPWFHKKSISAVVEVIVAFRKDGGHPYFTIFSSSEEEKSDTKQLYFLTDF